MAISNWTMTDFQSLLTPPAGGAGVVTTTFDLAAAQRANGASV